MHTKPKEIQKTARMSFLLEDELAVKFDEYCDEKGFNKSKLIRNYISSLLKEHNANNMNNNQKTNNNGVSFN